MNLGGKDVTYTTLSYNTWGRDDDMKGFSDLVKK